MKKTKITRYFHDGTADTAFYQDERSMLRAPKSRSKGLKAYAILSAITEIAIVLVRVLRPHS